MANVTIINGNVLTPEGVKQETIHCVDGVITQEGQADADVINACGAYVLPGIVDIHGDAFERILMPRPGVFFPIDLALRETDRQLIANGITTAYHGLTVSWEPGLRSVERTRILRDEIVKNRDKFSSDMRLHIRWETFALKQMDETLEMLKGDDNVILAFNDHTTKSALGTMDPKKVAQMAERSDLSPEEFKELLDSVWAKRDEVPGAIEEFAVKAHEAGAILLAHDEISVEQRQWFRNMGVSVSEFPLAPETARNARAHNEHTVLGAPNVVRGGSHTKALNATDAIRDGLCSILASDYFYPSMLNAAFKLVNIGVCDLNTAWDLISRNPAEAAQLHDRGSLETGRRADILIVDASEIETPFVQQCFVQGKSVYKA